MDLSEPLGSPSIDEDDDRPPTQGVGLCLSGGGYRAMLFHLGGLIRINQLGLLPRLTRVSSVSGGSITAAILGLRWNDLQFDSTGVASNFDRVIRTPVEELATHTLDKRSIWRGLLNPRRSIGQELAGEYRRLLFADATLQDLPADGTGPRFVINATNVQTGKLVRFSRPYLRDYTVGRWSEPTVTIADAVAASSAFPPVLSPFTLRPAGTFVPEPGQPHTGTEYTERLVLSDGGVYDNLGLQTTWGRCHTLFVCDGGGALKPEPSPAPDWARHSLRVAQIVDSQVRALRKRQLVDALRRHERAGTYWSIRSQQADYHLDDAIEFDARRASQLAAVPTRLAALDESTRAGLITWGYVIADTALRRWVQTSAPRPTPEQIP